MLAKGDAETRALLGKRLATSSAGVTSAEEGGGGERGGVNQAEVDGGRKVEKYERALLKKIRNLESRGEGVEGRDAKLGDLRKRLAELHEGAQEEGHERAQQQREGAQEENEGSQSPIIEYKPAPAGWEGMGLHPAVGSALHDRCLASPTTIQGAVIRASLVEGRDIVGIAETGAGKTLAYGIPIAHRVYTEAELAVAAGVEPPGGLRALVICPTRELCLQVEKQISSILKGNAAGGRRLKTAAIVGGISDDKQRRLISYK